MEIPSPPPREAPATSRSEAIFEALLGEILRGDVAPGDRLPPERALATRFATNRNTLREAVRQLDRLGLVRARQGQGVTVADFRREGTIALLGPYIRHAPDLAERARVFADLLTSRLLVLEQAVTLAARRGQPADFDAIARAAEAQIQRFEAGGEAAAPRDRRLQLVRGDIALIEALVDAAHSLMVRWTANTFLGIYRDLLHGAAALWVAEPDYAAFLHALARAVRGGAAPGAAALVRDYYGRTDARLLAVLERLLPSPAAPRSAP